MKLRTDFQILRDFDVGKFRDAQDLVPDALIKTDRPVKQKGLEFVGDLLLRDNQHGGAAQRFEGFHGGRVPFHAVRRAVPHPENGKPPAAFRLDRNNLKILRMVLGMLDYTAVTAEKILADAFQLTPFHNKSPFPIAAGL